MAKPFKLLWEKMSPQARQRAEAKSQRLLKEMHLQELRQAKEISQEEIAEMLSTKQANISRFERRTDMRISTLRTYVEAMGGKLVIVIKFPEGDVQLNQFNEPVTSR